MNTDAIKVIAFDLDGTLLDSVPDLAIATNQAVQKLGYPEVTEAQVREWIGNGAEALVARAINNSMDTQWPSDKLAEEALTLFKAFYQQTHFSNSKLYAGVKTSLETLHELGYVLAMVTNKPSQFIPEILRQHNLAEYFETVLGGDCVTKKKPHPEALLSLMEKYEIQAEQLLMVGDSKNDILAAKNAGCPSVGLTYGYNHGEPIGDSQPDLVIDNLEELLPRFF